MMAMISGGRIVAVGPDRVRSASDQVKAALAQLASTQLALAHGLAEIYTYRRANDEVAILAHRSLEFLARVLFEVDP